MRSGPARAAVLAAGLLAAGVACRAREDAFTERIAERLRARSPETRVAVKERLHLEIVKGETTQQLFLHNLWQRCQTNPESCEGDIERYLTLGLEGQGLTDSYLKPEFVRPVLKDRQWMDHVGGMFKDQPADKAAENALVSRPLVADLYVVYVFDLPDGMRMMTHGDMTQLKLDEARVDALAIENLDKASPEMDWELVAPGSRIRVMHFGDSYESSRVIPHARWKRMADDVAGDLVVAAPSRDFVYFT